MFLALHDLGAPEHRQAFSFSYFKAASGLVFTPGALECSVVVIIICALLTSAKQLGQGHVILVIEFGIFINAEII